MHQSELIMTTHLKDPRSTVASVGALYALLIAARPALTMEDWRRIHGKIRTRFQPKDDRAWQPKLDQIKARGWRLHDAVHDATAKQSPRSL